LYFSLFAYANPSRQCDRFIHGGFLLLLQPAQVLSIDMGTDSLTALGLGVERPDPQVIARPPRPHTERLLHWPLALRAYLFLGLIERAQESLLQDVG
jgi:magnesium-transporting ATPase (P-type)